MARTLTIIVAWFYVLYIIVFCIFLIQLSIGIGPFCMTCIPWLPIFGISIPILAIQDVRQAWTDPGFGLVGRLLLTLSEPFAVIPAVALLNNYYKWSNSFLNMIFEKYMLYIAIALLIIDLIWIRDMILHPMS